jgi:hypothetical protein
MERKERISEAEEKEQLITDCENTKGFKNKAMDIVREIARRNIERLREEYIQANMDMCVGDMDIVNSVFEFLRNRA